MANPQSMQSMEDLLQAFQQVAGKLNVNLPPMGGQPGDIAAAFTQNLGGGTFGPPGGGRGGVPFTQPLESATQGPAPYVDPNVRQPIEPLGRGYTPPTRFPSEDPEIQGAQGGRGMQYNQWTSATGQPAAQKPAVQPSAGPTAAAAGTNQPATSTGPGERTIDQRGFGVNPAFGRLDLDLLPTAPTAPTATPGTEGPLTSYGKAREARVPLSDAEIAAQGRRGTERDAIGDRFAGAREALDIPTEGAIPTGRQSDLLKQFGGFPGIEKIRREGLVLTPEEAKSYPEGDVDRAGQPIRRPSILSEDDYKAQAERHTQGKVGPPEKQNIQALVGQQRAMAAAEHRKRATNAIVFGPGQDNIAESMKTMAGSGALHTGGRPFIYPSKHVEKQLEAIKANPNYKDHNLPEHQRNLNLGLILNELVETRNATPGEDAASQQKRRKEYKDVLKKWADVANWTFNETHANSGDRQKVLQQVVIDFLDSPSSLTGGKKGYATTFKYGSQDNLGGLVDDMIGPQDRQHWARTVVEAPVRAVYSVGQAMTAFFEGAHKTFMEPNHEAQEKLGHWALQMHPDIHTGYANHIRASDARVRDRLMNKGVPQYVMQKEPYMTRYRAYIDVLARSGSAQFANIYEQIKDNNGQQHADQFYETLHGLAKTGELQSLGIHNYEDQVGNIQRMREGKEGVSGLHGMNIATDEGIVKTEGVNLLLDHELTERGAVKAQMIPAEEITREPDMYVGREGKPHYGKVMKDPATGRIIPDTHADWSDEVGAPLLPEGIRKNLADEDVAKQAQEQQDAADQGVAKAKSNKAAYETLADQIAKGEAEGIRLAKEAAARRTAAAKGAEGSLSAAAQQMTTDLVGMETKSMVEELNKEDNMLIFAKQMTEAFVMMGDSLTNIAIGRGPSGKPSYMPTSIMEAMKSVGAEREAAIMRLSIGTMTGHWFPKGSTVESMKSQQGLLTHTQNLNQKERHWMHGLEAGNFKAMLDYQAKILGYKIDADKEGWLRQKWEREFAHRREFDAHNYSLNRAKANLEHAGSLKLDRLELETINALKTTIDMGKEVLREKPMHGTGWAKNWWQSMGNYLGWGDPSWHKFKQKVTYQLNTYVNNLTGKQLSKHEVGRLKGVVPQMSDDDAIFVAKAKTFIKVQEMILKRKLTTYALNGHDVSPFLGNDELHWKFGGAERSGTANQFSALVRQNPNMIGNTQMLTGLAGRALRPGDDYLGDIMGNFIIMDPRTGKLRYNEEKHGYVDSSRIALGTQQGIRGVGQQQPARYFNPLGRYGRRG